MSYTHEHDTRWGKVSDVSERVSEHHTRHTYEGQTDAVLSVVGSRLHETTMMYEHMYRVDSVQSLCNGKLRVVATYNSYAGD